MIQIGNSSLTRDLTQISAKVSPPRAGGDRGSAAISDQVQLSDAAADISQGRTARIAALTAIVASPDYSPPSTQISRALISGALSRAA
jgi:hypothetical protein